MAQDITFSLSRSRFDENYEPSQHTRITTNFANLARGDKRKNNVSNVLTMIDNRFNAWPTGITKPRTDTLLN